MADVPGGVWLAGLGVFKSTVLPHIFAAVGLGSSVTFGLRFLIQPLEVRVAPFQRIRSGGPNAPRAPSREICVER